MSNFQLSRILRETTLINEYSFRNTKHYLSIAIYSYLIVYIVAIIPYAILVPFSDKSIFFSLLKRNNIDYAFLLSENASFADAYVGGILLQLIVTLFSAAIMAFGYMAAPGKIFVTDRIQEYVFSYCCFFCFFVLLLYILLNISDFGIGTNDVSWFQDNPLRRSRHAPMPMNSSIFVFTGLAFLCIFILIAMLAQVIAVLSFGKRVKFDELKEMRAQT